MVNLWNFLKPKKTAIFEQYVQNMKPLQAQAQLTPIQLSEDGSMVQNPDIQPERRVTLGDRAKNRLNIAGQKLYDALMGKQAQPTDNISQGVQTITTEDGETYNPIGNVITSSNPRTGGFFRDFSGGYQENRFTPASLDNFGQNTLADGRKKGFAYRTGEALGSLARFGESPLGRGLLVGGAIGALGGDPTAMLAFGASTSMMNQGNRMRDRAYRDDLIATAQQSLIEQPGFSELSPQDQQAQLQNVANQVNNYRGYVDNNTYNNMIRAQQIRDNAAYRKMYFDANQANLQAQREWQRQQAEQQRADRQAEFDYRKSNDAQNRALRYADLNDRRMQRAIDNYYKGEDLKIKKNAAEAKLNKSLYKNAQEQQATLNQIQQIRNYINNNPRATGLVIGSLTGDIANRFDTKPSHISTRTAIDDLKTKIRHDLTGAAFSAKEAREYEKFLPNTRDTKEIINAKLDALEAKITGGGTLSPKIDNNAVQAEMRRRGLL